MKKTEYASPVILLEKFRSENIMDISGLQNDPLDPGGNGFGDDDNQ